MTETGREHDVAVLPPPSWAMAHLSAHHTRTQTISNKQSGWYSSGGGGGGGGRRRRAERRREEARERTMEAAAAVTRLSFVPLAAAARPLLAGFMRPRVFASISPSSSSSSPFSGGGGGRFFGGGGGRGRGGGGGGGGEESGAGAAAAASAAAAVVLGETETADADVILLRVGVRNARSGSLSIAAGCSAHCLV